MQVTDALLPIHVFYAIARRPASGARRPCFSSPGQADGRSIGIALAGSVGGRVSPWLYTPVDSIAIRRLRQLGWRLPFKQIKEIDSHDKFYGVQELLGQAAEQVDVPRIWFDDNWGDRQ